MEMGTYLEKSSVGKRLRMDKGLREVDDFINHVPKSNTLRKSKEEIYEKVNQNNL